VVVDPFGRKPDKRVYPDQDEVVRIVRGELGPYFRRHPFFMSVSIWGSLAQGAFGVFPEPYHGYVASDIDLLAEVDEKHPIPGELREYEAFTGPGAPRMFTGMSPLSLRLALYHAIDVYLDYLCIFPSDPRPTAFLDANARHRVLIYSRNGAPS
jgi:hypothetical protein